MRIRMLFFVSGAVFVCGCTSSQMQQSAGIPAVTTVAPAKVDVPAQVIAAKNEMTCKRGEEKRLLEVESLEPKGCKLWYARYEIRNSVASSTMGISYCEKVRENIRTKLVGAGFDCLTIQSGAISKATASPAAASTVSEVVKKAEPVKK